MLREGWTALVGAVLPVECAGCGLADTGLCAVCRQTLRAAPGPVAERSVPGCPPVWAVAAYEGRVREVLVAWKDHGRLDLSREVARAAASAVAAAEAHTGGSGRAGVLLVPVPSGRWAVRRRGEDLVAGLARAGAVRLRRDGREARVGAVLRQVRRVRDQAALPAAARRANLDGAFTVPWARLVGGRRCLLVDDVVTTGATLAEAGRALEAAGGLVVGAATVAATPRRFPGAAARRLSGGAGVD